ncbi:hypothetical protein [Vibrio cidicii]|uniref:hypothetical protein n=1 Tax=Vibrio cidicii TaxID=1763883 RepID=UPI0018C2BC5B|nr:hypothetical protein [Vibrio cidicii]ELV8627196.1 hypothetical protein [Vibrio cidicii]MBG0757669.1 hypothetical protein [Vibrio cidicii]
MERLFENELLNVSVSLFIALAVCYVIQLLLTKVFQPKGLGWVLILFASICIFLVASTVNSNESYFYWLISSAKWALVGIAGISIQKIQES